MIEMNRMWDVIADHFEMMYPHIANDVVDWYPSGQLEITVKTSNGNKYTFSHIGARLTKVYDTENYEEDLIVDEEIFRNRFARCLRNKLYNLGMSQEKLSELTGISYVTISKYMTGKATPSYYNVNRIARALKCSVSELEVR